MMVQLGGIVFKLYDCDPQRLSSAAIVWRLLRGAARESWTTRWADGIARLPSGGISGFVRSREMQIAIHTRPLQRYAEISLSLCDRRAAPDAMGFFFAQGLASSCLRTIEA
jgi:S-adenosylmethionine/arginine decarboxylase-like enzyme